MADHDELMTRDELIGYLKLDAEGGDPTERVRNLIRRHGLPVLRCGRLLRFRRSHVDQWLAGERFGNKVIGGRRAGRQTLRVRPDCRSADATMVPGELTVDLPAV